MNESRRYFAVPEAESRDQGEREQQERAICVDPAKEKGHRKLRHVAAFSTVRLWAVRGVELVARCGDELHAPIDIIPGARILQPRHQVIEPAERRSYLLQDLPSEVERLPVVRARGRSAAAAS